MVSFPYSLNLFNTKHTELLGSPFPWLFESDREPSSKMDPNLSESILDSYRRGTKANLENPDSNLTFKYPSWKGDNSSFPGPSLSLSNNFSSHPNPSSRALSSSPSLHSSDLPEPTFHEEWCRNPRTFDCHSFPTHSPLLHRESKGIYCDNC